MRQDLQRPTARAASCIEAALLSNIKGASRQTLRAGEFTSLTMRKTSGQSLMTGRWFCRANVTPASAGIARAFDQGVTTPNPDSSLENFW
jgi:hypothetical protein